MHPRRAKRQAENIPPPLPREALHLRPLGAGRGVLAFDGLFHAGEFGSEAVDAVVGVGALGAEGFPKSRSEPPGKR